MRARHFVGIALTSVTFIAAPGCVGSSSTPPFDAGGPDAASMDAGRTPASDAAALDAADSAAPDAAVPGAADSAAPDVVSADTGSPVDAADAALPLQLSPLTPTAKGCSSDTVTFTASGGAPPYVWSTSEGGTTNLTVTSPTQVEWHDGSDNFCGVAGSVTITVTDAVNAHASTVMTVTAG